MAATYDTLRDPWIPAVGLDGEARLLGIRDALIRAHELREVRDPFPTVEFGLYRLLVALALDAFAPRDTRDLVELLDGGRFDPATLDEYLARPDCKGRFDLFDQKHPFLQASGMDGEPAKPLAGLLHAIPSGTNAVHFHHGHEDDFAVSPAVAARLLTTVAPFMTAGGAGLSPSINGAPPWYVLVHGPTLFYTLCLNVCALPMPLAQSDGAPAWRAAALVRNERRNGASLLEALTWQPRRIQLIPGAGGRCCMTGEEAPVLVRSMRFSAGWGAGFPWVDPNVPYVVTKDGRAPLRAREGRELWRDTGPLALLTETAYTSANGQVRFDRPLVVSQLDLLAEEALDGAANALLLNVYGLRTDMKMKVFEWQRESVCLPARLAVGGRFRADAQRAMDLAQDVEYRLRRAIKAAYPRSGAGNDKAFDSLLAEAQRQYWAELRPDYNALLNELAWNDEQAAIDARAEWQAALRKAGLDALNAAIDGFDSDADALRRQVEARRVFQLGIYQLFLPPEERERRRKRKEAAEDAAGGATT